MDAIRADLQAAGAHHQAGRLREAESLYRKILSAAPDRPDSAEIHCNLGYLLSQTRRHDEAIIEYRKAIALQPTLAAAHFYLAMSIRARGDFQAALDQLRLAARLDPVNLHARNQLAAMLTDSGDVAGALEEYRAILRIDPALAGAHSNILVAMHCLPDVTPQELFDEHVRFGQMHADTIEPIGFPGDIDRNPDRRLRIGYVSPDFREHSVAAFIAPVIAHHDRARFEIFAYADLPNRDEVTARLSQHFDHFREITGLSNPRVAGQIRDDRIDILIDLAGHTSGNRLFVFARKPAPVLATWIGYPNTTGVKMIDYRITDAISDPSPHADARHVERLIRLPGCFLCFAPPAEPIEPAELPRQRNGFVTFGAFNRMAKASSETIAMWSKILQAVPQSRLLIKGAGLTPATMPLWRERLKNHGIDLTQIELLPNLPTKREHLLAMSRVDLALDTYPYNATTVACEWLWMGVPIVTRSGHTHASRVGRSLLTAVGHPELIADSAEAYIDIAVRLAGDATRLKNLRTNLRSRFLQSPLTDAVAVTRNLESAYRHMWQTWCAMPA